MLFEDISQMVGNPIPPNALTQSLDVLAGGVPSDLQRWHAYFSFILHSARGYEAQLLHDHVYAILGIMERYLPSGFSPPIIPNYELPFEEVYISTSFYLLQNISNLVILNLVEDKSARKRHTLPSWVPDFSTKITEPKALDTSIEWNACGFCSPPLDSRKLFGRVL
jgi:hypothetical protein